MLNEIRNINIKLRTKLFFKNVMYLAFGHFNFYFHYNKI